MVSSQFNKFNTFKWKGIHNQVRNVAIKIVRHAHKQSWERFVATLEDDRRQSVNTLQNNKDNKQGGEVDSNN